MTASPRPEQWRQISGDMDPGKYGAVIGRFYGEAIELLEIQPARELIGDRAAVDLGFPFWSKEAYYHPSDLSPENQEVRKALENAGVQLSEIPAEHRAMTIAECLLRYGHGSNESTGGFARDVLGDRRVLWWGATRPRGWRYLADGDREFRALQRERRR